MAEVITVKGEDFSIIPDSYKKMPDGMIKGEFLITNNQMNSPIQIVTVRGIIAKGESQNDLILGILIPNTQLAIEKAKECGVTFPSQENPDKVVARKYLGKFNEAGDIGIFYGNPFSEDTDVKEKYKQLIEKLKGTEFFGQNKFKSEVFVDAIEQGIKAILGYEEVKKIQSVDPKRFINPERGNNINR